MPTFIIINLHNFFYQYEQLNVNQYYDVHVYFIFVCFFMKMIDVMIILK